MQMTIQTHERLQKELEAATAERDKWHKAIGEAAGSNSDWHDNASYDYAVTTFELMESRERELRELLRSIEIIEPRKEVKDIQIGNTVKLNLDGIIKVFHLLGSLDSGHNGWLSIETPVGSALVGKKKGEIVEIELDDRTLRIEVLEVLEGAF